MLFAHFICRMRAEEVEAKAQAEAAEKQRQEAIELKKKVSQVFLPFCWLALREIVPRSFSVSILGCCYRWSCEAEVGVRSRCQGEGSGGKGGASEEKARGSPNEYCRWGLLLCFSRLISFFLNSRFRRKTNFLQRQSSWYYFSFHCFLLTDFSIATTASCHRTNICGRYPKLLSGMSHLQYLYSSLCVGMVISLLFSAFALFLGATFFDLFPQVFPYIINSVTFFTFISISRSFSPLLFCIFFQPTFLRSVFPFLSFVYYVVSDIIHLACLQVVSLIIFFKCYRIICNQWCLPPLPRSLQLLKTPWRRSAIAIQRIFLCINTHSRLWL